MTGAQRWIALLVLLVLGIGGLWWARRPGEAPDRGREQSWVEGLQAARQARSELTDQMRERFDVSLESRDGALVGLVLANREAQDLVAYGGLLHLRNADGERVCTLWLNEQQPLAGGATVTVAYETSGEFVADPRPTSELQASWEPFRLAFADGTVLEKPWPTQSWWPWCQAELRRRGG